VRLWAPYIRIRALFSTDKHHPLPRFAARRFYNPSSLSRMSDPSVRRSTSEIWRSEETRGLLGLISWAKWTPRWGGGDGCDIGFTHGGQMEAKMLPMRYRVEFSYKRRCRMPSSGAFIFIKARSIRLSFPSSQQHRCSD
jgi:hypothetical protein